MHLAIINLHLYHHVKIFVHNFQAQATRIHIKLPKSNKAMLSVTK